MALSFLSVTDQRYEPGPARFRPAVGRLSGHRSGRLDRRNPGQGRDRVWTALSPNVEEPATTGGRSHSSADARRLPMTTSQRIQDPVGSQAVVTRQTWPSGAPQPALLRLG